MADKDSMPRQAWVPEEGQVSDFPDYQIRKQGHDVYFDLEYVRQTRDHEGAYEDDDWQLITAISAVVENRRGRLVSLYEASGLPVRQPDVAIDRVGEIKVIAAFLRVLVAWQDALSTQSAQPAELRLFNYSGSAAEGRLWKKLVKIANESSHDWPFEQIVPLSNIGRLRSLLEYNSSDNYTNPAYGDGIERFDLARVVRRLFEPFPSDPRSKYGLKVVERFLPGFSRPGSLVGSEESIATWLRIKEGRHELTDLEFGPTHEIWTFGRGPLMSCQIEANDQEGAGGLKSRRLAREIRRLERSYKTYAEWDCRAVWYLHRFLVAEFRHLVAPAYSAQEQSCSGTKQSGHLVGRRSTSSRHGVIFG